MFRQSELSEVAIAVLKADCECVCSVAALNLFENSLFLLLSALHINVQWAPSQIPENQVKLEIE